MDDSYSGEEDTEIIAGGGASGQKRDLAGLNPVVEE